MAKYGACSFWRVIFWGIYRLKNRETIAGQSSPDGQSDELKTDSEQNHDKHIAIQDLIETKSKTDWYLQLGLGSWGGANLLEAFARQGKDRGLLELKQTQYKILISLLKRQETPRRIYVHLDWYFFAT